jgi:hypothetical protein
MGHAWMKIGSGLIVDARELKSTVARIAALQTSLVPQPRRRSHPGRGKYTSSTAASAVIPSIRSQARMATPTLSPISTANEKSCVLALLRFYNPGACEFGGGFESELWQLLELITCEVPRAGEKEGGVNITPGAP